MVEISNGPGGDGQGRSGLRARPTRAARSAGEPGPRVRDSRVLDRLAAGDEQALAELYDGYARTAYSLAQRICRDEHLAETVVVTVFRTLWQAPPTCRPVGRRSPPGCCPPCTSRRWTRSAAPVSPGRSRTSSSRRSPEDPRRVLLLPHPPRPDLPWETPSGAIAGLPAEQAQTIILGYYGGYTQRQVAAILGIPLARCAGEWSPPFTSYAVPWALSRGHQAWRGLTRTLTQPRPVQNSDAQPVWIPSDVLDHATRSRPR